MEKTKKRFKKLNPKEAFWKNIRNDCRLWVLENWKEIEKTRDWISAVAIGFLLAVLIVFFAILFFIVIMLSDKKILILSLVVFVVAWILFTLFI